MIIDANTWLGHWPFRQLRHNDVAGLLHLMDANGIDLAVVANTHGVFYKNAQKANEELAEWVAPHRDRLVPFATMNPGYPGWQRNLGLCRDVGMKGLRLYPIYHDYKLTDAPAAALVGAATEMGWPVQLPMRIVDARQRHWMDTERNLTPDECLAAVQAYPGTSFIFSNALGLQPGTFTGANGSGQRRVVTDLARMSAVYHNDLGALLAAAGAGSVVFGTGMPFNYPGPAFLKVEALDASAEAKELLRSGNMRAILRL